ncbi:ThuA domain-containing protein [Rhodanobacter sp. KK11]|uniref:ThuA domain-containing protein n=1 Tax=Rhodanobacter sp. KK11 TaxID=3083255 RepID=UPI002966D898|nr:ThuA domain-containing protein [Rhodanobacter sp. KK11]MDW2979941.1 ThuA domain-containing protein [Rhodanobacter sp. KK11]
MAVPAPAVALRWLLLATCAMLAAGCHRAAPKKIVLIGGAPSEGPARHDYGNGIRLLAGFLQATAAAQRGEIAVASHPDGWPADPHAFDGAAAVVLYFDGDAKHPLRDAARRQQFEALMQRGAGLVALHQASTVPAGDDSIGLQRWLGGARFGMVDRTTETTLLQPAAPAHPVTRGVQTFAYRDEFYPTIRFAASGRITPILTATLHVQYRDGKSVVEDQPELATVAWAYQRPGGGRSFGFSGAHYLVALDQPMLRRTLLNAMLWSAGLDVPPEGASGGAGDAATRVAERELRERPARRAAADASAFHRDPQRTGWNPDETVLTPASVAGPSFGLLWESPPLDAVDGQAPRLYASPLYVDRVTISAGEHQGETFAVAFAASSNGYVYAINTEQTGDVAAGRILWRTRLATPCRLQPQPLDAVPTGVLSTPVIDVAHDRLYVTGCDPQNSWQAYALDLGSGAILPGWPVRLDEARLNDVNRNAGPRLLPPTRRFDFRVQRGALNLSPDGSRLYVVFGETETGWLVSVDTAQAKVDSAFAAVALPHRGSGGIWGAGGPAVDDAGNVFVATGSGYDGFVDQAHDWTQSVLKLSDAAPHGLRLEGTYTPFNYCVTAKTDIDLGSGGAILLPALDAAATTTPQLLVVGGKQGNAYLLDRARMPGRLDRRPPCSEDAAGDGSLLSPQRQPPFAGRGPLNVFGPYSDKDASMDLARARSVPAAFRGADGTVHVYMTGNTRLREGSPVGIPPSLVRLDVATAPGEPAWLRIGRTQDSVVFGNPGSPVVSSHGAQDAIVWVLDENAKRSAPLAGADAPSPVLYAFDADSLRLLWKSAPGTLFTSGKYNEPLVARGQVLVGTDRIQAFGLGGRQLSRARGEAGKTVPAAMPANAAPAAGLDGRAIYRQRCAMCHDHPQGNIPSRARIAARPRAEVIEALTHGVMRPHAAGLSVQDIEAVAGALKP